MRLRWYGPTLAAWLLLAAPPATADEQAAGGSARAAVSRPALEAVVRGLFVQARVGGGYMVADQAVKPDATFPQIKGREGLGPGAMVNLALGYDLTDTFAIEALGGVALASGSRTDRVRDMGIAYVGAGLGLALSLRDRLHLTVRGGGAMARADNGVEKPEVGPAAVGSFGIEYYVHVRHFSVGLDASVLAALSPLRIFVGLGPHIKYTF